MLFKKEYNIKGELVDVLVYDKLSYDIIKNHPKSFDSKIEILIMFVDEKESKEFIDSNLDDISTYILVTISIDKNPKDISNFVDKLMKYDVGERWNNIKSINR